MKKLSFFLWVFALLFFWGCHKATKPLANKKETAAIEFEKTEHDFGTLKQGGNGSYDFVFKNTGKEPLILTNVRPSCGCTASEWPKDPIPSGQSGRITVKYNTRITGSFAKSISVYSNAGPSPLVLLIRGKVEPGKKAGLKAPYLE
jgi:hypothetical protein